MNLKIYTIFCVLLLTTTGVINVSAQQDQNARDIRLLTEWFEGEFDNDSQIWFQNRYGWAGNPEERHDQMHTTHFRINDSALGNHVFYVEEYIGNDPAAITRQRIVSFESLAPAAGIAMKIYFLKEATKYVGANQSPALLNALTQEDLFGLDGCDVIFQRNGEQYEGGMVAKACQFGEGDKKRYSVHDMVISKNQYWRVDRTFLVKDDSFYKGHVTTEPHKMRRANFYSCNVSFHEKAYYIPSEKDKFYKDIIIHDQGELKWFDNPMDGKKYGIQMREKEYPYYAEGSDFFMLRFKEEGQKASKLIVTAELYPEKIAFQMGWVSVNCKAVD